MFEKFMEELRIKANENNLNTEEIIGKYQRRYKLAIEAGFSERETIEKFGSIDKIIESYKNDEIATSTEENKHTTTMDLLQIDGIYSGDVTIKNTDKPGITYKMDNAVRDFYNVDSTDKIFTIRPIQNRGSFRKNHRGDITVYINHEILFREIHLSVVSADLNAEAFDVKCDELTLSTVTGDISANNAEVSQNVSISVVSGDIDINSLISKKAKINTVSGDIHIKKINIDTINASTVSGDIIIDSGFNTEIKGSSISGQIILNNKKIGKNLNDSFEEIGSTISKMKF